MMLARPMSELRTVQGARHLNIAEYDFHGQRGREYRKSLAAVAGLKDGETGLAQVVGDAQSSKCIVFHNQDYMRSPLCSWLMA